MDKISNFKAKSGVIENGYSALTTVSIDSTGEILYKDYIDGYNKINEAAKKIPIVFEEMKREFNNLREFGLIKLDDPHNYDTKQITLCMDTAQALSVKSALSSDEKHQFFHSYRNFTDICNCLKGVNENA